MNCKYLFFSLSLLGCLITFQAQSTSVDVPTPVGEWLFNNPDNPLEAEIGSNLILVGSHELAEGPMPDNGAITIGRESHYIVNHEIVPGEGQKYVNQYSISYDFKVSDIGKWRSLLQANPENSYDAHLFIRKSDGMVGVSQTGYSSKGVTPGQWHRLIVSVNNGLEYSLYLDSEKILTGIVQEVDGSVALRPNFILFGDNDGEDEDIDIARVALYDVSLKPEEVIALGKVEVPYNPFLTSPYLQNVTKTGITIMWESEHEVPGKVHYGIGDNYKNEVIASVVMTSANTYVNKAVIKDLAADTKYNFFVTQSGTESKKQNFATAPDSDNASFTVSIWADSHYPMPFSKMVDYMMNEIQPDLALNAGDLCNTGTRSDLSTVYLPHVCEEIGSYVPFYSALGNHDMGAAKLIRQYHDQPKEVNSDPNGFEGSYLMMYSNVAFIFIDWDRYNPDLLKDAWLEQTLQSDDVQNARFRFVFIHAAPYYERWQVAEWPVVKDNVPRLAEKYNINAVFSGHMHGYERGVKNGVHYLTIGGGSPYFDTNALVGPVIYDHIIRGTDKPDNPPGFNNGLRNHFAELKIKDSTAEIRIHYFDIEGSYLGVIESFNVDDHVTQIEDNLQDSSIMIYQDSTLKEIHVKSKYVVKSVDFYNLSGTKIHSVLNGGKSMRISTGFLPYGAYIISINSNNSVYHKKIEIR